MQTLSARPSVVGGRPAAGARRHGAAVCAAHGPQQQQAAAAVDRRTLLTAAGAVLAGAALQQGQAAQADDCEFQTAASGMQYCDLAEGSGEAPVPGARIRAHYTGRLQSNGVVFDSSYQRGRPLIFQIGVGQVIKGWDQGILGAEGIPAMKPGGKRRLVIPPELAYGQRGAGGVIPPNATLVFDVEYLGVQGKR
ncbi:FKBP-type peptidyl-prolyl cis-trans isomerase [Chlorella sorokiniana]|uniref:peptidylprolyl isomerase n=1 Tax=Chlorella sorokiniana TaxID=3076 RepID=A0A2P6TFJ3_CHLSO|nr:FKBP-type peptidyl-prolyl cis-trans isomerase [Chlorella sorokiniana]|eukprot:PRW32874.1 FKBP-type peptidyl-prolyl cis-trans isomerase [Chlorella sorokiniana]